MSNNNFNPKVRGIKAVLEQSLQPYEKLPMLEVIFEKFTRHLTVSLRNMTSETVNVEIKSLNSTRFNSFFKTIDSKCSIGIFRAVEWENFGLLLIDNNLVFNFIDILLGGKKNTAHSFASRENRPLTPIEQNLAKQILELFLEALSNAFEQITSVTFILDGLENNQNFATIVRPGDGVIVVTITLEINEYSNTIELVIPHKTIEPIKEKIQQVFLGDRFGTNIAWEEDLVNSVSNIPLPIEAVIINKKSLLLQDIIKLKVGDTIVTTQGQFEDVTIRTANVNLFTGQIGKVEDKIAISITNIIEK